MEWTALTYASHIVLARHGRLNLSDWDLVLRLRDRDGTLATRAPSHTPGGRCKYARYYPRGGCPWCQTKAAAA